MNNRGFTLIELLIVIAIIGILAGAVIISLGGVPDKATDATNKYQVGQLRAVAIDYFDENEEYNDLCGKTNIGSTDKAEVEGNDQFVSVVENVIGFEKDSDNDNVLDDDEWNCTDGDDYWYFYFKLKDDNYWCVDKNVATEITLKNTLDDSETSCEDLD